jgi:selenocysteine lyase/cysteine desulfurase
MGAACDYLMEIGMEKVEQYEHQLSKYLYEVRCCCWLTWWMGGVRTHTYTHTHIHPHTTQIINRQRLSEVEGVRIYGPKPGADGSQRAALCAFNTASVHASDLAFFLDHEGVAIRSGHHCTQPLHRLLDAKGSARASLYIYNTREDVDALIVKLRETMEFFGAFSSSSAAAGGGGGGAGGSA